MQEVVLVIHLILTISLVVLVLIQKSSGGALGIGGGQGGGMSGRGVGTLLTRLTTYLAVAFFATSLGLAVIAKQQSSDSSVFDTQSSVIEETVPEDTLNDVFGDEMQDKTEPVIPETE